MFDENSQRIFVIDLEQNLCWFLGRTPCACKNQSDVCGAVFQTFWLLPDNFTKFLIETVVFCFA